MDLDKKYHVLHLQYYIQYYIHSNTTHRNRKRVYESNQNKDIIFRDVIKLAILIYELFLNTLYSNLAFLLWNKE